MIIELDVDWKNPHAVADPRALAWGQGILRIDGEPYWYHGTQDSPGRILWTWSDLLSHLVENWPYLALEQSYPTGLSPGTLAELRQCAERRWELLNHDVYLREEAELFKFEEHHDLARGMSGISLPHILIMRQGAQYEIWTENGITHQTFGSVIAALENTGATIAKYMAKSKDPRAAHLVARWQDRWRISPDQTLDLAAGWPAGERAQISGRANSLGYWELDEVTGGDSELLAAARMSVSRIEPRALRQILDAIKAIQPLEAEQAKQLDEFSHIAQKELNRRLKPYEQGYRLAQWFRDQVAGKRNRAADPKAMLKTMGVGIWEKDFDCDFDAIGCWGTKHGPAIFLNTRGRHNKNEAGRRATLAHELCHLLVDRSGALPVAEVLGGWAPRIPEQRANAFAAEFLLPQAAAADTYTRLLSVELTVKNLCHQFRVNKTLAAWQLYRAKEDAGFPPAACVQLERMIKLADRSWVGLP